MLKKWRNHHVSLLAALTAVSSAGFVETQAEPGEHRNFLPYKLLETLKSGGVATLSLGPVCESAGNTQTLYLAPNIEKTYAANNASHALVAGVVRHLNPHWQLAMSLGIG